MRFYPLFAQYFVLFIVDKDLINEAIRGVYYSKPM